MTLRLWVLVGLCAAGIILPLIAAIQLLVLALRLQRRIATLSESSFVTKLESLQIQIDRLSRVGDSLEELKRRAIAARDLILNSVQECIRPIRISFAATESEVEQLRRDLT